MKQILLIQIYNLLTPHKIRNKWFAKIKLHCQCVNVSPIFIYIIRNKI